MCLQNSVMGNDRASQGRAPCVLTYHTQVVSELLAYGAWAGPTTEHGKCIQEEKGRETKASRLLDSSGNSIDVLRVRATSGLGIRL